MQKSVSSPERDDDFRDFFSPLPVGLGVLALAASLFWTTWFSVEIGNTGRYLHLSFRDASSLVLGTRGHTSDKQLELEAALWSKHQFFRPAQEKISDFEINYLQFGWELVSGASLILAILALWPWRILGQRAPTGRRWKTIQRISGFLSVPVAAFGSVMVLVIGLNTVQNYLWYSSGKLTTAGGGFFLGFLGYPLIAAGALIRNSRPRNGEPGESGSRESRTERLPEP